MWQYINTARDAEILMQKVYNFHDCCIKEIKYKSGAYVDEKFSMHPVNDSRILNLAIQSQRKEIGLIELEFSRLNWMKLLPANEYYTCEILDATLVVKGNTIYWCDCGGINESDLHTYTGTVICASGLRWRIVNDFMGNCDYWEGQCWRQGDGSIVP